MKSKSIQSRLLIMLLVFIILPYSLSVLLIYRQTKENVERHELENSRKQMQLASEELEQYFNELINLPYSLYRNPDLFMVFERGIERSLYFSQREINKGMTAFYLMKSEIRQVRIYIDAGKDSFTVYNAMVSSRKWQPELMKQTAIQKLIKAETNFLIEPPHPIVNYNNTMIIPSSDKQKVLTIHFKILDALSKKFLGIVTIDIDLSKFARLSKLFLQQNKEAVLLYDSNGHVIYASDEAMIGKTVPAGLVNNIQQSAEGEPASDGNIILSTALSEPLKGWRLVTITESDFLYKDVRKTAYTNIIVGVIVVGLGLLMIAVISHKIAHPIKRLSRKVQRIEGTNMNAPFDDNREDEIGHLERHIKAMMERINRHIDREYKLDIENRKNQHRALMSQINPHFLFNALQSIGAVAALYESPRVYRLITSLSKMMRYSIRTDLKVTVRSEAEYVRAYLDLQEERFQTDFTYSIDLPESILDISVPSMILQPLVENFFKHCYEAGCDNASLRIYGRLHSENLILVVEDNGKGMTSFELRALNNKIYAPFQGEESLEHIGLKNINDRLVLHYGKSAGITLDSMKGQGFSVQLVIPIHHEEEEHL